MTQNAERTPRNALEKDPKFERFGKLYIESGNANASAIKAGYSKSYAKGHAWELVCRLEVLMPQALKRVGLDQVQIARKLKKLTQAKAPKWNPHKLVRAADPATQTVELRGDWDYFEDGGTQLRACSTALELLDAFPATTVKGEGPGGSVPVTVTIVSSIPRPVRPKQVGG